MPVRLADRAREAALSAAVLDPYKVIPLGSIVVLVEYSPPRMVYVASEERWSSPHVHVREGSMYLLTMRAAIVFIAASVVAVIAAALLLADGNSWPVALLGGGGAFGVGLPVFNGIIPPSEERQSDLERGGRGGSLDQ